MSKQERSNHKPGIGRKSGNSTKPAPTRGINDNRLSYTGAEVRDVILPREVKAARVGRMSSTRTNATQERSTHHPPPRAKELR